MTLNVKFEEQEQTFNVDFGEMQIVSSGGIVNCRLQEKTVIPSKEQQRIVADGGYDGLSKVTVETIPNEYIVPEGSLEITENGEYDIKEKATAVVNVPTSSGDTLKTLLEAKGTTYYLFYNYQGESVDGLLPYSSTENLKTTEYMFVNCPNLTEVPSFDTRKAEKMTYMFYNCPKLTKVPLLDYTNVQNFSYMFNNCTSLTEIPIFNTTRTNINLMGTFTGCKSLTTAKISYDSINKISYIFQGCSNLVEVIIDNANVYDVSGMFSNCTSLKKAKIGKLSRSVSSSNSMFYNCTSLEIVDFRGAYSVPQLTNKNAFTGVPSTCKIIIPDSLYDSWTKATNWAGISVVWVKESEYVEE